VDGQTELVKNSRSAKRWRIGRIVLFGTLASIPVLTLLNKTASPAPIEEPYLSMVRLNGAIGPGEGVNAESTVPTLFTPTSRLSAAMAAWWLLSRAKSLSP
jgi:hypothetical protein